MIQTAREKHGPGRFLTCHCTRRFYDAHRGGVIPPAAALEREIVGLGVEEKQKDKARGEFSNFPTANLICSGLFQPC